MYVKLAYKLKVSKKTNRNDGNAKRDGEKLRTGDVTQEEIG